MLSAIRASSNASLPEAHTPLRYRPRYRRQLLAPVPPHPGRTETDRCRPQQQGRRQIRRGGDDYLD